MITELNTSLVLLEKEIDQERFPRLYEWRDIISTQPDVILIKEFYMKRIK